MNGLQLKISHIRRYKRPPPVSDHTGLTFRVGFTGGLTVYSLVKSYEPSGPLLPELIPVSGVSLLLLDGMLVHRR